MMVTVRRRVIIVRQGIAAGGRPRRVPPGAGAADPGRQGRPRTDGMTGRYDRAA
ncbi:hypothetical protein GCM10027612_62850 [Microbispora bryophytorum subsp. camponoti]